MDWFIRRENIKHYRKLLEQTNDIAERTRIERLLAEEEAKGLERPIERPSGQRTV